MKKTVLLIITLSLLFFSCTPDEDKDPEFSNEYLVSYEKLTPDPISTSAMSILIGLSDELGGIFDINLLRYRVDVYRVTYKTLYKGVSIEASGACLIPKSSDNLPLLSYQHGTIFENRDAPSEYTRISETTPEMWLNIIFASAGYICSMPDYIGYGVSKDTVHPYLVAQYTASASIDMMRAVKELCNELNRGVQNRCFLTGYSEGGYATLALMKEIEAKHSDEFPLVAVAAGSGAYDIGGTATGFMKKAILDPPHFLCYVFLGHNEANGWNRDLSTVFLSPYRERIEAGLFNGDYSGSEIKSQLTINRDELFVKQFVDDFNGNGEFEVKESLRNNSIYEGWVPGAPLKLFHGLDDKTVPPSNSIMAYENFVNSGAKDIELITREGLDHSGGIFIWLAGTLSWFDIF